MKRLVRVLNRFAYLSEVGNYFAYLSEVCCAADTLLLLRFMNCAGCKPDWAPLHSRAQDLPGVGLGAWSSQPSQGSEIYIEEQLFLSKARLDQECNNPLIKKT